MADPDARGPPPQAERTLEELLKAGDRAREAFDRLTREMQELASQIADARSKRHERRAGREDGSELPN